MKNGDKKLKINLSKKEINKKFKKIKSTIKDANESTKDISRFEKKLKRKRNKYKLYNKFSIFQNGVVNDYEKTYDVYMNSHKELKKLKKDLKNQKQKKQKLIIKNKIKKFKEELKRLRKKTKIEKRKLKSEIQQINILNEKPKGPILIENKKDYVIEVKNVSKIYTTQSIIFHALKNINLSIKKGTFNVILGPSGSGKTTLLNIISGLDRVTTGSVAINGYNIQGLTNSEMTLFRKEKLGFVFQSYNLLTSLNVKNNIDVGRSLQKNRNKRMNINNLLANMDMENNRKKMTYELSGGQQQRVSIARALSKTPDILIGDEPTGALDQDTSIKVFELFQEINKNNKTTVIIVTHNPNFARLADLIIKVKDGEIKDLVYNKKPIKAKRIKEI